MKKKIFTLLTALVLSIGIGWATDYNYNFTWSMIKSTTTLQTYDNGSVRYTDFYYNPSSSTKPCLRLVWGASSTQTVSKKAFMPNGSYVFQLNPGLGAVASGGNNSGSGQCQWVYSSARYYSMYYPDSSTKHYFSSGNVVVEDGADGKPYVVVTAKGGTSQTSTNNNYTITIGSPMPRSAGTISVAVKSGQSAMGTVSGGGYGQGNAKIQISATANSGYNFKQWDDGNKDNPRTVVVDGDHTYTAEFVDLNTATLASFSWDTDDIGVEVYGDGDSYCTSFYAPYGKQFILLYAEATGRSTKNYLQLSIQSAQTQMWGEVAWAKTGDYPVVSSGLTTEWCGSGIYWYWTLSQTNVCVAYGYDDYALGMNELGSYLCDKKGDNQTNYLSVVEGMTCKIEEGKDGNPWIRLVRNSDQQCLVSVGEPAVQVITHKVTFMNGTTVLQEDQVAESQTPAYTGATPTKESTVSTVYTFTGWNDGTTSYAKDATLPAVGSNDVTYTAIFEPSTRQYAITINASTNGTIKVMNGNTEVQTGDKVDYNTVLTVTTTPSTGYHLDAWTTGTGYVTPNEQGQVTVTGDIKLGATFAINQYTITVASTEHGDIKVAQGDNVLYNGNEGGSFDVDYGTELTLTATATDAKYQFATWTNEGGDQVPGAPQRVGQVEPEIGTTDAVMTIADADLTTNPLTLTITGTLSFGAEFDLLPTKTVTINECDGGYIKVSDGTTTVTEPGVYEFAEGTTLHLALVPTDGNDFGEWVNNSDDEEAYSEAMLKDTVLTDNIDLYAAFMLGAFTLKENQDKSYYDGLPYGQMIRRVTLDRTFKKNAWSTMCLPFFYQVSGSAMDGVVYRFIQAEGDNQKVTVKFSEVTQINPGSPYMLLSGSEIKNPVFDYVTFVPEEGIDPLDMEETHDDVTYHGVLSTPATLTKGHREYRYVASNQLYYPAANDVSIVFDRCYFTVPFMESVSPRIELVIEDESITDAEEQMPEINKYIENGILVIERGGEKYTATGSKIE